MVHPKGAWGNPGRPGLTVEAKRPRRPINCDSQFFADGLAQGRILLQYCNQCGTLRHPPRPMCAQCHAFGWDVREASGRGRIYSYAVHHHPPVPGLPRPNVILLVDLVEGVRMVGDLIDAADDPSLAIGAPVTAEIRQTLATTCCWSLAVSSTT